MPLPEDIAELVTLAGDMFTSLTAGNDFTIPDVDLSGPEFEIPDLPVETVSPLTEAALTSRTVGGAGLFDGIMVSVRAHIEAEFQKNRLTAAQMAEVLTAVTNSAMSQAMQFLLQKDTSHWQARIAERQAAVAQLSVIEARVRTEEAKVRLAIAKSQAHTTAVEFAIRKLQLATETTNLELARAQLDTANYTLLNILPAQKLNLDEDILTKQAQRAQTIYQTEILLPAQKQKLDEEIDVIQYQLSSLMPAQLAGLVADTAGKVYTNDHLLPAQLASIEEQTEGHRAKTLDTRTDGLPVSGAMGIQKLLYEEQITSYKRDAETKAVKIATDIWTVQKTVDEGLTPPSSLANAKIDLMYGQLLTNLALPTA